MKMLYGLQSISSSDGLGVVLNLTADMRFNQVSSLSYLYLNHYIQQTFNVIMVMFLILILRSAKT